jgi:hypothetical protein
MSVFETWPLFGAPLLRFFDYLGADISSKDGSYKEDG